MSEGSGGIRILVVEDDSQVRDMVRKMLESAGHTVEVARNGRSALELLQAKPIDLVVTDIMMPHKDGIESIIEIRRRFQGVKIIAMSGGGQVKNLDFLEFAGKVGAAELLAKPFRREQLLAAVARTMGPGGAEPAGGAGTAR